MKHLKRLLTVPLQQVPRKIAAIPFAVALIGFADAVYLTIEHYRGAIPPCSIGGCETVLTSSYSVVFGIPVALFGTVYYLLILVGLFAYLESRNEKILRYTLAATVIGFLISIWLLFVQAVLIGAYCLYCLVSSGTSIALFASALYIFSKYRVPATLTE